MVTYIADMIKLGNLQTGVHQNHIVIRQDYKAQMFIIKQKENKTLLKLELYFVFIINLLLQSFIIE